MLTSRRAERGLSPGDSMKNAFVTVPAREARAVRVRPGGRFRVVDIEGGQVVDLFAFATDDIAEYASAEHTRVHINRLFPRVGESFVTNRRRPILQFEEDDSPGVHDMLCAACDPTRYQLLGVDGWHPSCQENLQRTMAALDHTRIEIPQPVNLFMAVRVEPDGAFTWSPAPTKAGDSLVMRAELDCIVVASACPQDLNEINHYRPTPIGIELLEDSVPSAPRHHHRLDADLVAAGLDRLLGVLYCEGMGHQVLERVDLRVPRQERQ
jgi:uncharacterized protein YcgI (DUF1989 family)